VHISPSLQTAEWSPVANQPETDRNGRLLRTRREIQQTHNILQACEECRKRKRKCDGKEPTCYFCHNYGHECTYLQVHATKPQIVLEDLLARVKEITTRQAVFEARLYKMKTSRRKDKARLRSAASQMKEVIRSLHSDMETSDSEDSDISLRSSSSTPE
jgi:hypothetical protein